MTVYGDWMSETQEELETEFQNLAPKVLECSHQIAVIGESMKELLDNFITETTSLWPEGTRNEPKFMGTAARCVNANKTSESDHYNTEHDWNDMWNITQAHPGQLIERLGWDPYRNNSVNASSVDSDVGLYWEEYEPQRYGIFLSANYAEELSHIGFDDSNTSDRQTFYRNALNFYLICLGYQINYLAKGPTGVTARLVERAGHESRAFQQLYDRMATWNAPVQAVNYYGMIAHYYTNRTYGSGITENRWDEERWTGPNNFPGHFFYTTNDNVSENHGVTDGHTQGKANSNEFMSMTIAGAGRRDDDAGTFDTIFSKIRTLCDRIIWTAAENPDREALIRGFALTLERFSNPLRTALTCVKDAFQPLESFWETQRAELNTRIGQEGWPADQGEASGWMRNRQGGPTNPGGTFYGSHPYDMIDTLHDMDYARTPEKLFFKEQCYLLSYVAKISSYKRNVLDATVGAINSGGPCGDDVPYRSLKRLPYMDCLSYFDQEYYGNASLLIDGDPYGFVNKLVSSVNQGALANIPHHVLSALQPYIRLFKVVYDNDGNETDVEITFETSMNSFEMDLFQTQGMRGVGAGLKSFTYTYDGSNPFAARKSIKANLKIFANSFDELLMVRESRGIIGQGPLAGTTSNAPYRFTDLAMKTAPDSEHFQQIMRENNEDAAGLNFRLKAVVGYTEPSGDLYDPEISAAIRASTVTLNLTPTVHTFSFDELGRVVLDINYLAYVEDLFATAKFNVFSKPQYALNRIIRELKMDYYESVCQSEDVTQIKKEFAYNAQAEIRGAISNLFSSLLVKDKVFYMSISETGIRRFLSDGPFANMDSDAQVRVLTNRSYRAGLEDAIEQALDEMRFHVEGDDSVSEEDFDREEQAISTSLATMSPGTYTVSFFYISDLVDIVLDNIGREVQGMPRRLEEHQRRQAGQNIEYNADSLNKYIEDYNKFSKAFERLRVLLGPVEFTNPNAATAGQNHMFVNFGDMPVSTKYFFEWITGAMISRQESYLSLNDFLNQLFNELVTKFLNSDHCFPYSIKQKTRVFQASITGHEVDTSDWESADMAMDPVTDQLVYPYDSSYRPAARANINAAGRFQLPLLKSSGLVLDSPRSMVPSTSEINYLVYYAGRTNPTDIFRGNKIDDEARGIIHYQIGQDRGLVKKIDLKKTQTPGLTEVRFETTGYDGLEQLLVVYDAQIESFLNTNTYPGTYIFIDPHGFSPAARVALNNGNADFDLTKYGIGGYYMIVRSTHNFAPGMANSSIEAKWVNKIAEENSDVADWARDSAGSENMQNMNCEAYSERQNSATEDQSANEPGAPRRRTLRERPADPETHDANSLGFWNYVVID